jgi:crotonobetainyl-CoA:carnitine CoA-transferase CaiB-like acyl-CoA transferase
MTPEVDSSLPLSGIRVLAVEQMYSLPFATQLLSYLGADIVKIEPPGIGEMGRYDALGVRDDDGRHVGYTYARNNLGKKSVCIDLKHAEGRKLLSQLLPRFDVFASNFRPGVIEKLGFDYETVRRLHPKLVYMSISGFGTLNPTAYAERPGFAPIVEAMAGLYEFKRKADVPPVVSPVGALGDLAPGVFSVVGVLAALTKALRTGQGSFVDVAMYDVMAVMADVVPGYFSMDSDPSAPETAAGVLASFKASDGWFVVMALRDQHLRRLAEAIGHPEWNSDVRFSERIGWNQHLEDVVRPAIDAWAAGRTRAQVCAELGSKGVAAGPCHQAADVVSDPHLLQHEMLVQVPRPDRGKPFIAMGNPIKFQGIQQRHLGRWPRLGEHTEEVLRSDLGLCDADIRALGEAGAIAFGGHR